MADEVLVNDVADIIRFKSEFKDFMDFLTDHMMKLQQALDEKVDELSSIKKEIQQEREMLDHEIRQAKSVYDRSHDCRVYYTEYTDGGVNTYSEPDYQYILECKTAYEHLAGPVYHQTRTCEDLAHAHLLDAIRHANLAKNATSSNLDTIRRYVENGDDYLGQIVAYIESYMESSLEK